MKPNERGDDDEKQQPHPITIHRYHHLPRRRKRQWNFVIEGTDLQEPWLKEKLHRKLLPTQCYQRREEWRWAGCQPEVADPLLHHHKQHSRLCHRSEVWYQQSSSPKDQLWATLSKSQGMNEVSGQEVSPTQAGPEGMKRPRQVSHALIN